MPSACSVTHRGLWTVKRRQPHACRVMPGIMPSSAAITSCSIGSSPHAVGQAASRHILEGQAAVELAMVRHRAEVACDVGVGAPPA